MLNEAQLKKKVREILFSNMIKGYSKELDFEYCFTQPAKERYPFQYFWDTCFHTIMLTAVDETDHAKWHLQTLFAAQSEDGFIGNIIYWKHVMPARLTDFFQIRFKAIMQFKSPHMSSIIQPPLIAQAVNSIYKKTGDREFLREMLPKMKRYYHWLAQNRDFDGDYLLSTITTFESGMDWKPTYDPVVGFKDGKANSKLFRKVVSVDFKNFLRNYNLPKIAKAGYFRVKDAGFNSIYANDLQEMSLLCKAVDDPDSKIYEERAGQVIQSMLDILYDEKDAAFYDVYGRENRKIRVLTPTIFYPVIIDDIPRDISQKVMEKHFYESKEFRTPYPIPSVAQNEPAFNPKASLYLWRGPTWIVNNWFMHKYLVKTEHQDKANILMNSMIRLIENSGFREYYDPFTGEGYGAKNFTWTGLIIDMMENES